MHTVDRSANEGGSIVARW